MQLRRTKWLDSGELRAWVSVLRCCALLVACTAAASCAAGRPPVPPGVIPEPQRLTVTEEQYGHQILDQLSQEYPLDYNNPRTTEVLDVVDRLTKAAHADADPWHVYIFRDPAFKNAAATRGNHVFIWSAMLDATHTDAELAAVLAHEISHVLARHTDPDPNEELKKLLIGVGAMAAGIAVSHATGGATVVGDLGDLTSSVTQELGSGMLVYPYSRDREFEADQIGLFMMADAKFDPRAAIDFWQRAESDPAFSNGLAFFSTHPPAGARLERLKSMLPAALARFRGEIPPGPVEIAPGGAAGGVPADGKSSAAAPARPPSAAAHNPNAPRGDSFEVDPATVPGRTGGGYGATRGGANRAAGRRWIVVADKALLYRSTDPAAKALGEFSVGARIEGRVKDREWIEVDVPDHGYIKQEAVAAEP